MAMMISKFHKIIQSKVVWTIFAILISVAFVSVYTGSRGNSQKQRQQQKGQIAGRLFGQDISRADFGRAYRDIYVMYSLSTGRAINITEEIDELISHSAWVRLATLMKAEELGLKATPEQTIALIRDMQVFHNEQTGQFDKNIYNTFVSSFLPRTGMTAKGFEVMMGENVLIDKASRTAAQGALVTEEEIRKAYHYYRDNLTVEYAPIPRSLAGTPTVTDAEALEYYNTNMDQFRLPEKAIVNYVQFPVAEYTDNEKVTDTMVSQYYENNKAQFAKPAAEGADAAAEPEYRPFDEVKEAIQTNLIQAYARKAAADAADAFVSDLADESTTFEDRAEQAGLQIVDNTPAFSANDQVKGVDPTAPFARATFNLETNAAHYYSDPVVGRDFVYVIDLNKKLGSFIPGFEVVKPEALNFARAAAAEKAYMEKAKAVHSEIKTALSNGTSFADALSKYGMELNKTAAFNVTTTLEDTFGKEIKSATLALNAGDVAELIRTSEEYLVAYVAEKELADEGDGLADMRDDLAKGLSREKAAQLTSEWQEALLKEGKLKDLRTAANDS